MSRRSPLISRQWCDRCWRQHYQWRWSSNDQVTRIVRSTVACRSRDCASVSRHGDEGGRCDPTRRSRSTTGSASSRSRRPMADLSPSAGPMPATPCATLTRRRSARTFPAWCARPSGLDWATSRSCSGKDFPAMCDRGHWQRPHCPPLAHSRRNNGAVGRRDWRRACSRQCRHPERRLPVG